MFSSRWNKSWPVSAFALQIAGAAARPMRSDARHRPPEMVVVLAPGIHEKGCAASRLVPGGAEIPPADQVLIPLHDVLLPAAVAGQPGDMQGSLQARQGPGC